MRQQVGSDPPTGFSDLEVPILVVGAGPAGLTASLLLSRAGMDAETITDPRWPSPYGVDPTGAVVVRPDGYVAWRHRGPLLSGEPPAADLISSVVKRLTAEGPSS